MAAVVDERVIRAVDVDVADASRYASAIDEMYADRLDVLIVRRAIDPERLAALGATLDTDADDPGWARPNQRMPIEDIQVLGSPIPATPTYSAPTGASLDAYLESAQGHHAATAALFGGGFDVNRCCVGFLF